MTTTGILISSNTGKQRLTRASLEGVIPQLKERYPDCEFWCDPETDDLWWRGEILMTIKLTLPLASSAKDFKFAMFRSGS